MAADRFRAELESASTADELEATTDRALRAGVFGVPTFVAQGELFRGNDRLVLLRHHLRSSSSA